MTPERRAKVIKWLGYGRDALGLIPNIPGSADDLGIAGARALLSTLIAALKSGRSTAELVEVLRGFVAEPADRLEVDEIVARWLAAEKAARSAGGIEE